MLLMITVPYDNYSNLSNQAKRYTYWSLDQIETYLFFYLLVIYMSQRFLI